MPYTPSVQDRSGEILAQGITQGFSSLTQGVEKYYKKREEKEILDSTVTSLMSRAANSPKLAQFLGVNMSDENAVRAGIKAAGGGDAMAGAKALRQSLQQFGEFERQEKERENDNATFNTGITRIGNKQDPFVPGANYSPRVAKALSDITTDQALAEERRAAAARVPKPEKAFQQMNLDEINDLRVKGYDVEARPVGNGMYEVSKVSPFAPGAVTNINTGDRAFEATVGKAAAERLGAQYDAAKSASRTAIPKLDQTLSILQNQEPNTGILAELATNVDRARATLLNEKAAGKRVSDTQLLESMLGSDVFTSLGAINLGSRNIDTPKEREFLQKVITGEIKLEKSTLIEMTEMRRKLQSQVIDNYNEDVKNGDYDEYFKAARMKAHTFDVPSIGGSPSGPSTSSIRRDPQGREYIRGPKGEAIPVNR